MSTILKVVSEEAGVSIEEVSKHLVNHGPQEINDDSLSRAIQKHLVLLLHDIQFTLNSFSLKLNFYDGVSKILFIGPISSIKDCMTFCSNTLQIPSEEFDARKLLENKNLKNKANENIAKFNDYLLALGIALPSPEQSDFDLRRKQFIYQRKGLLTKQLIVGIALSIIIILSIGVKGYFDISELSSRAKQIEKKKLIALSQKMCFLRGNFLKNLF